jgi:NAD(P)-dependent dehydrogenase (short-subunit alcohol dehydrogenase family)
MVYIPFFSNTSVPFEPSKDIPSLAGKVILVTGGNTGLGKQSILELARYGKPSKIYLAARDQQKAKGAIDEIKTHAPDAPIVPLDLDLTSFESIKDAARTFLKQEERLDVLMLNAGIMAVPNATTKEGYEIQFGTNHVGHALLTKLLLPTLLKTARRPEKPDVRVVVLTSAGLGLASPGQGIKLDSVKTDGSGMYTWTRYGQSKLANALFARELAKRYPEIKAVAVHPGVVDTQLMLPFAKTLGVFNLAVTALFKPFLKTVETGARNQVWATVSKEVESGEWYTPVGIKGTVTVRGTDLARDDNLAKKLWDWTEKELEGQEI